MILWRGCVGGESYTEICVRSMNDQSGVRGATSKSPSPFTSTAAASSNIYKLSKHNVVTSDGEGGRGVNNKINTICMYIPLIISVTLASYTRAFSVAHSLGICR